MDENPQGVATDENVDVEETTNSNEDSEQENTVDPAEELENERKAKAQILARAKKAEDEVKRLKESKAETPIINQDPYFADELRLIADKVRGEAILKAKIIAKGSGVSLLEAIKDPAVVAYIKEMDEHDRKERAKLGASKGSGESKESTGITGDMSREEHQKAFEKVMGKVRT